MWIIRFIWWLTQTNTKKHLKQKLKHFSDPFVWKISPFLCTKFIIQAVCNILIFMARCKIGQIFCAQLHKLWFLFAGSRCGIVFTNDGIQIRSEAANVSTVWFIICDYMIILVACIKWYDDWTKLDMVYHCIFPNKRWIFSHDVNKFQVT